MLDLARYRSSLERVGLPALELPQARALVLTAAAELRPCPTPTASSRRDASESDRISTASE